MSLLLDNAHVVTMDDEGSEHPDGWVLLEDGLVAATGGGAEPEADERFDVAGALVTPGLINTHHHLYQTLTRARAQEADLFTWLKTLYPVWARIDEESEHAAARTGLAELALSGCTTVFDHHYLFPHEPEAILGAELRAAQELGLRIVASRGSMDLGASQGGLPPDSVVEPIDAILADVERAASRSVSARISSASSTSESGGRPPSDSPRSIDPREGTRRTPSSRAAVISASTRSPAPRGKT